MATRVTFGMPVSVKYWPLWGYRKLLWQYLQCRTIQKGQSFSAVTSTDTVPEHTEEVDEVTSLRNVSRLPKLLHLKMEHKVHEHLTSIDHTEKFGYQKDPINYQRRLYAKYGRNSGVDPAVMWPNKAEMKEIIEDDLEWEPSLQERWSKLEAAEKEEIGARRAKYVHRV